MRRLFKRVPFVIAEAGVNHNGGLRMALRLVDAAAKAGADAVKFQTFRADRLATPAAPKARYQKARARAGESQLDMLRKLELSPAAHRSLLRRCAAREIEFLSTPFDEESADMLDRLGMKVFKVASGEITNPGLLAHIAGLEKPVILSTGMSTLAEVGDAVRIIRRAGNPPLALLHCVSSYPAAAKDANLRAMRTMAEAFKLPVGYSDHTPGIEIPVAAAALGAVIIEKHFTLDKGLRGPDHAVSLEPEELTAMVRAIRNTAAALGDGVKAPRPCEREIRGVARRSLTLTRDARSGERLTPSLLAAKRPATGISPMSLRKVLGRKLRRSARAGAVLRLKMLR